MQHLKRIGLENLNFKSPIYKLEDFKENEIYIMRDDLIPFSFGGNKARKAYNFFNEILKNNYNYVITYGSASSNHCRIISNLANKFNIKCTIISTEEEHETSNKIMCEIFGAEFIYCKVNEVKETIDEQIKEKIELNYNPYFIQGGGHGNLGTQAYIDAYKEILEFEETNNIKFDYIFHASGTGTTQAGLILGKEINASNANVVGVSIARKLPRGRDVVIESIKEYLTETGIKTDFKDENVKFLDDYVLDGYGKYNEEILREIKYMMCKHGIPMDTTYTGKAFWGMKEYMKKQEIKNKKILFIHTGGIPIFFDIIKELK